MTGISVLEWLGSLSGIGGALLMAANTRISGLAYPLWVVSSVSLLAFACLQDHGGLALQQSFFLAINVVGVWRWMIRPPYSPLCSAADAESRVAE